MPDADWRGLCRAEDEVYPTVRADDVADLANLERVRHLLERLLHLTLKACRREK